MATFRRAALFVRATTADRGQTGENQLHRLQKAARRLGWLIVSVSFVGKRGPHRDLRRGSVRGPECVAPTMARSGAEGWSKTLPISLGAGKRDHHTLVTRLVVVSPDAEFAS